MAIFDLSIVIPLYNEEGTINELYTKLKEQFRTGFLNGEIIFVDDGSTDRSKDIILALCEGDTACRLISFRANCGKAAALSAGFKLAEGKYIITMDADLQDDPDELPKFLTALKDYDVVSGWKKNRLDPTEKRLPSKLYNATVRFITGSKLHDMNCGFKGYRREVLKELRLYGELHRYIPALLAARGFTVGEIVVKHHERKSGYSKYGIERFLRGLFDLMTVVYLTRYIFRPLHLFGGIAALSAVFGVIFWILTIWVKGFTVLATALLSAVFILLGIGIILERIAYNTHPDYIPPIRETKNCN